MPSRIVSFFHPSVVESPLSVQTTFSAAVRHEHDLRAGATPGVSGQRFRERLEGIRVRISAVGSPAATTITVQVSLDPGGDDIVVPATDATVATGITTSTKGAVAYSVKLPIYQSAAGEVGKLYVHLKANHPCTVDQTTLTWTET